MHDSFTVLFTSKSGQYGFIVIYSQSFLLFGLKSAELISLERSSYVFILREASFKGYQKYYHAYTEEDFTRIDDFMIEEMQRQNGQNSLILGNKFSSTNCHIYPRVVVTLSIYLCLRG